jgi:hypothetical protein
VVVDAGHKHFEGSCRLRPGDRHDPAGDVAHLKFVAVTEMGGGGMRKFEKQLDVDVSMNDTRDRQ